VRRWAFFCPTDERNRAKPFPPWAVKRKRSHRNNGELECGLDPAFKCRLFQWLLFRVTVNHSLRYIIKIDAACSLSWGGGRGRGGRRQNDQQKKKKKRRHENPNATSKPRSQVEEGAGREPTANDCVSTATIPTLREAVRPADRRMLACRKPLLPDLGCE